MFLLSRYQRSYRWAPWQPHVQPRDSCFTWLSCRGWMVYKKALSMSHDICCSGTSLCAITIAHVLFLANLDFPVYLQLLIFQCRHDKVKLVERLCKGDEVLKNVFPKNFMISFKFLFLISPPHTNHASRTGLLVVK